MKNSIPPINEEIDYLNKNEHEIYCVGDWVQKRIGCKMLPVRFTAIRHDGAIVSNSQYFDGKILDAEKVLSNLHLLLSSSKELYSTRPALCVQYAVLLIETDHAIVRLNIDKNILKNATIKRWPIDYRVWAEKIREAAKNWGYKDFRETDDVCYFDPGFDYKQFLVEHETFWQALQDKLNALVKILKEMNSFVNGKTGEMNLQNNTVEGDSFQKEKGDAIYISYPWTVMEEIDSLCGVLEVAGLHYKRDIKDCSYRQNIQSFEEEIGKGAKVLAFINDDYMKSINCMYELACVFQRGNVENRLYPIVNITGTRGIDIQKKLYDFWNDEYQRRLIALNKLPSGVSLQVIEELSDCDTIIRELPKIVSYITQVNTLNYEKLRENGYERLVKELEKNNKT